MNKIDSLDHIAINVKSIEDSVMWYESNFDCKVKYKDETWALLDISGVSIALTLSREHPPHIGFLVKEFPENLKDKVKKHRDNTEYVYMCDNSGNMLELIKRV